MDNDLFSGISFADDSTEFDAKAEFGKMTKVLSALVEDMKFIKKKKDEYPYPKPGAAMPGQKQYSEDEVKNLQTELAEGKKNFEALQKKFEEAEQKLAEFDKKATDSKASELAAAQVEKGIVPEANKDAVIADYSKNFSAVQLDVMLKHVKDFSAIPPASPSSTAAQRAAKSTEPGQDSSKLNAKLQELEVQRQDAVDAGLGTITLSAIDEQIAALKSKGSAA